MRKIKLGAMLIASTMMTFAIAATTLSPNQNNQSGIIPSGYDDLIFALSYKNWVKDISLPDVANEGALLVIKSTAQQDSRIDLSNVRIENKDVLPLSMGDSYRFKFTNGKWELAALDTASFSPANGGDTVPAFTTLHGQYTITDSDWTGEINLPATATGGQFLVIKSDAAQGAKINSQNALFPSTFGLNKNDMYIFQYSAGLAKWVPLSVPTRIVRVVNSSASTLAANLANLTAQKTEVRFGKDEWISTFTLPKTANDRDRIIVTSSAYRQATIRNENTNTTATLKLNPGQRYEFMYVADKAYWVLMSAPKLSLTAQAAAQGFSIKTPMTEITSIDGQSANAFVMPRSAQTGDKIIISNTTDIPFNVSGNGIPSTVFKKGDKARFVFANGVWNTDSYQIDLLLVNSPVINDALGETAAKIQAREGLRRTNEALQNSQAKAYFKEVGYIDYRIEGTTLNDAIKAGRTDTVVQDERTRTGADAVFVITDHSGCGLAWQNANPNKYSMIAGWHYTCGLNVMRHELGGHNMGIGHSFNRTSGYNWGFSHSLGSTIMGGNQLDFYSSPDLYSPQYGIRLGKVDEIDGVRQINDNAEAVSNFFASVN